MVHLDTQRSVEEIDEFLRGKFKGPGKRGKEFGEPFFAWFDIKEKKPGYARLSARTRGVAANITMIFSHPYESRGDIVLEPLQPVQMAWALLQWTAPDDIHFSITDNYYFARRNGILVVDPQVMLEIPCNRELLEGVEYEVPLPFPFGGYGDLLSMKQDWTPSLEDLTKPPNPDCSKMDWWPEYAEKHGFPLNPNADE